MAWLQEHKSHYASTFLPGLSREEIEATVADLPGQIPEEVYELYQWRNGTPEEDIETVAYPYLGFIPLEEAVQACKALVELNRDDELVVFEGKSLFPFFCSNGEYCSVILDSQQQEQSLVLDIGAECDVSIIYKSLTSMMVTLAECCETGAYYIGEIDEEMGGKLDEAKGFLCVDEAKMLPIFQRNNPGVEWVGGDN